jgi:phage gpG-like protein
MGCSVNHAQLSQVEKVLGVIISKGWLGELAQRISAAGMKLVADEFKTETDPYGKPWAPLKRERTRNRHARLRAAAAGRKVNGQKILQDTGRMKNSVGAAPRGFTARLVIPTWYAAVHQNGSAKIPQRMMLPNGDLPDRWRRVFEKESNLLLAQKMELR